MRTFAAKSRHLVLFGMGLLTACAGGPASLEADAPGMPDIRPIIAAHKNELFKDPDSIRDASIGPATPFLGLGWQACLRANGKNGFGGYTGLHAYTVLVYKNGAPPLLQEPTIYSGCGSAAYQPFPEIEGDYKPPQAAPAPQTKKSKTKAS